MGKLDYRKPFNERLRPIDRLKLIIITTIILFLILGVGSMTPVSKDEAEFFMRQAENLMKDLTAFKIFLNNFAASLLSYIPFIGVGVMGFIIFQTGKFLGYISTQSGINPVLMILMTIATVYGLVEFLGYAVAVSEGILVSYSIVKRSIRSELRWILISIGVSACLLLLAAFLESFIIYLIKRMAPI